MAREGKSSFLAQAAILTAASLFARLLGFLYRLPITGWIGDEGNGIYGQSYYIYMLFLVISSAGLPSAISKMVSERAAHGRYKDAYRIFKLALASAAVLGLVSFAVLLFGAEWIASLVNNPRSYWSLVTLAPTVLIVAITAAFRGYFQGMGTTVPSAVSQVIDQIFNAVFSILLTWMFLHGTADGGDAIANGAAGSTLGTGVGALAGLLLILMVFRMARGGIKQGIAADKSKKLEDSRALLKELFSIAIPIVLGTAILSITNIIDASMIMDRLMNGAMLSEERATALYGQLTGKYTTLTTLPITISTMLAAAAIPSIAASKAKGNIKAVKSKINTSLRFAMMLSIPAAVGMGVLAEQIYMLLFPRYSEGAFLLQIGSISIIFMSLTQITTGMLQAIGKVKVPVIAALCGVLVKIPLNRLLIGIPELNVSGAVISTIAFCAVAAIIDWAMLCRCTGLRPDIAGILIKPLFASAVMGMAVFVSYYLFWYAIPSNAAALCVSIVIGVVVYFITLLSINGLKSEDIAQLPLINRLIK